MTWQIRRIILCTLVLGWALCSNVWAQRSIPRLTSPVVDEAALLSEDTKRQLIDRILAHRDSTSNQLAVLTIPSLDGDQLEEYSLRVARNWQLGEADKNNGVLILVAVAERSVRIEVGYGLEGDLPDISAKRIIDHIIIPYFREGDFNTGIREGVTATLGTIEGSYSPDDLAEMDFFDLFIFAVLPLIMIGSSILSQNTTFWIAVLFSLPFVFMGGQNVHPPYGGYIASVVLLGALMGIRVYLKKSPKWSKILAAIEKASPGDSVPIDIGGRTFNYRLPKAKSGSSSSGGYRGGGGSFGGGGASGRW